eukprot:3366102-Rhodomonas_salina.1
MDTAILQKEAGLDALARRAQQQVATLLVLEFMLGLGLGLELGLEEGGWRATGNKLGVERLRLKGEGSEVKDGGREVKERASGAGGQ